MVHPREIQRVFPREDRPPKRVTEQNGGRKFLKQNDRCEGKDEANRPLVRRDKGEWSGPKAKREQREQDDLENAVHGPETQRPAHRDQHKKRERKMRPGVLWRFGFPRSARGG